MTFKTLPHLDHVLIRSGNAGYDQSLALFNNYAVQINIYFTFEVYLMQCLVVK